MKKLIFTLLSMTSSFLLCAQSGVGTINPQGAFHVDGAKDNPATGTPSSVQQSNDFIITPQGNVGMGTTQPNASAILDINVNNLPANAKKGVLFPQVALISSKDITTIPNPVHGLMIYNTATAGTAPDNVVKDNLYRYDSTLSKWIKFMDESSPGSARVSTILGFNPGSANDDNYLSDALSPTTNNIRIIKFDKLILNNVDVADYSTANNEFTANKTGYFNFQINLVVEGKFTGAARLGVSKPYTTTRPIGDNKIFSFLTQTSNISTTDLEPLTLLSTGMLYMKKGEKIVFLTRFITPTENKLDVESINYDRTLVSSVSVTYIAIQ